MIYDTKKDIKGDDIRVRLEIHGIPNWTHLHRCRMCQPVCKLCYSCPICPMSISALRELLSSSHHPTIPHDIK
jgi:hypothetical protein